MPWSSVTHGSMVHAGVQGGASRSRGGPFGAVSGSASFLEESVASVQAVLTGLIGEVSVTGRVKLAGWLTD